MGHWEKGVFHCRGHCHYHSVWTILLKTWIVLGMGSAIERRLYIVRLIYFIIIQPCFRHWFQCGKLNFWSICLKRDVSYMFHTKFHLPKSIFYSPSSKFTSIDEQASVSFHLCGLSPNRGQTIPWTNVDPIHIIRPQWFNPLRAKFFRGNINIYLHFVSFLHIDTTWVVEILPKIRQKPTYST